MKKRIRRLVMKAGFLFVVLPLCLPGNVQAASFDCAKASTKVEKIICDNPEISMLDDELSASYKTALQDDKQADSIKHAQKQWMKERNGCADADCVQRAYEARLQGIASPTATSTPLSMTKTKSLAIPDKPGLFKLDQSMNDKVCGTLGQIINEDIIKYGTPRFGHHDEFVKWREVKEEKIDRGSKDNRYYESVERADADINNDGVIDQVIRTRSSLRGVLNDDLDVLPSDQQEIIIDELQRTGKTPPFDSSYWLHRQINKYGELNFDWFFSNSVAALNLYLQNNVTYVIAYDYVAPINTSAKIYIFKYDKDLDPIDMCMFVRICPCGGCEEFHGTGNQPAKTLPAKRWCGK
jgi:uncharacterized protein